MIFIAILICVVNTIFWGVVVKNEGTCKIRDKDVLLEEIYIGAGVGVAAGLVIWWPLCPILAITCGLLWGWAGAKDTSKNWRRVGVALLIAYFGLIIGWWALLSGLLLGFAMAIGYGVPDPKGAPDQDPGSRLGRFWFKITRNYLLTNLLTRATVGLLYGLSLIPLVV